MHTATYSPDDNKLRLYPAYRLGAEEYARVKAAGFKWAPKQELFVAPAWGPERADLLLEMCGEIGDEDTSLIDRAEDRAERFEDYSDSRAADAAAAHSAVRRIADGIPLGQPILVGHHSEKHARKDAERIENGMRKAVKMWETSKYWTQRAQGAIRHAKYKERPDVRARRIKGLEADRRKCVKNVDHSQATIRIWSKLHEPSSKFSQPSTFLERAKYIAGHTNTTSYGVYSALTDGKMTAEDAQRQVLADAQRCIAINQRWIDHIDNRLAYERALLADAGGTAADKTGPEKGGACQCWASPGRGPGMGWSYIAKVNKVTVTVWDNWGNGGRNFTRTIPFDKLIALMTAADVQSARASGRLIETDDKVGFFLADPKRTSDDPGKDDVLLEGCTNLKPEPVKEEPQVLIVRRNPLEVLRHHVTGAIERGEAEPIVGMPVSSPSDASPYCQTCWSKLQDGKCPHCEIVADMDSAVEAMRDALRKGSAVQVVSAPQLFPTPNDIARQVVDLADIQPGHRVLEPSAGTGALLGAMGGRMFGYTPERQRIGELVAVEINASLAQRLETLFPLTDVRCDDFLVLNGDLGSFDRIVMNPPFQNGADIIHIEHAISHLNPGGRLVAVCANGPRQRKHFEQYARQWIDLPAGSFKESGTMVNAAIVVIDAREGREND